MFPVALFGGEIWSVVTGSGIYNAVSAGDADGDGVPEVAAAIYYFDDPPDLYLVSGGTGNSVWTASDCQGTWGNKGLASLPDVTGDGLEDIVIGTPGGSFPGSSVIVKDGLDGSTVWSWCTYTQGPNWGWVYCVAPFIDFTGDGYAEVLASAGGNSSDRSGTAFLFNGASGDVIWTFRPDYDGAQCIEATGDVNGSEIPDVLVGAGGNGYDNRVFCLEGSTGVKLWEYNLEGSVWDVISLPDVDGDLVADAAAGGWSDLVVCLSGTDGHEIWRRNMGHIVMELALGDDVNGDGVRELFVASWSPSIYCLDGSDGTVLWSSYIGSDCWSVTALGDVDGDGVTDAAGGSVNGLAVKCLSGADGTEIWTFSSSERVYDVSRSPDLNGDHLDDVLISLQDQQPYPYQLLAWDGDGLPTPEVSLLLSPVSRYASPGETVDYTVELINNTDSSQAFWFRSFLTLPGGGEISPFEGPVHVALQPGQHGSGAQTADVPLNAPQGKYIYTARIGNPPDDLLDEKSFPVYID